MTEENLLGKGRHRALVRAAEKGVQVVDMSGERNADGSPKSDYVAVCFDLTDPNDPYCGWSITAFLYLSDRTLDRTVESLRHCGWRGDDLCDLPELAAKGMLSQEVEIVVDHEEFNGKTRAKVKWVNQLGGGTVKIEQALEGRKLADFSARMKGRIRAASMQADANMSRQAPPSPRAAGGGQAPHPNAPDNLDDIPFASCDMHDEPTAIAMVLRRPI